MKQCSEKRNVARNHKGKQSFLMFPVGGASSSQYLKHNGASSWHAMRGTTSPVLSDLALKAFYNLTHPEMLYSESLLKKQLFHGCWQYQRASSVILVLCRWEFLIMELDLESLDWVSEVQIAPFSAVLSFLSFASRLGDLGGENKEWKMWSIQREQWGKKYWAFHPAVGWIPAQCADFSSVFLVALSLWD